MPRIIVQNRIPRVKIGNRPIAVAPSDTGGGAILGQLQMFYSKAGAPTVNFTIPVTGRWKFFAHGAGNVPGGGTFGGDGGAYAERTLFLGAGAVVGVRVAGYGVTLQTTITFPDGTTMFAASGVNVGGGDVMYPGGLGGNSVPGQPGGGPGGGLGGANAGAVGGGGGGAGTLQSPGGAGLNGSTPNYFALPGGGASSTGQQGGTGLAAAYLVA